MDLSEYLSSGQVARELELSQGWINVWAREGRIKFIESPMGRLFPRSEVERLKQERSDRPSGTSAKPV